jgi:hypothetical protein
VISFVIKALGFVEMIDNFPTHLCGRLIITGDTGERRTQVDTDYNFRLAHVVQLAPNMVGRLCKLWFVGNREAIVCNYRPATRHCWGDLDFRLCGGRLNSSQGPIILLAS